MLITQFKSGRNTQGASGESHRAAVGFTCFIVVEIRVLQYICP
jgi:hypothetical protein